MRKALLHLGRTPIARRMVAAVILLGGAAAVTFARFGGRPDAIDLGSNLVVGLIALAVLHFRWRKRERQEVTPAKARDIFS